MSRKKRPKGQSQKPPGGKPPQAKKPSSGDKASAGVGPNLQVQRLVAMLGFGFCGLLVGFLTGANHLVPVPETLAGSILAQAGWVGASVGSRVIDLVGGLSGALLGGVVGSTLGFSLFLAPSVMLLSWTAAGALLTVGMSLTGNAALGAIGWMAGYAPFLLQEFLQTK